MDSPVAAANRLASRYTSGFLRFSVRPSDVCPAMVEVYPLDGRTTVTPRQGCAKAVQRRDRDPRLPLMAASVACPECGTGVTAGTKFCPECGARQPERPAPSREVRKLVTVLFADVTGSTALGEQLDPEALRALMTRYFTTMRSIIERHGGTVEKFIGDAVMAVFGIPTVHEDDALRAVRAASEIRDALGALNERLDAERGIAIRFRTGVNTGE